MKKKSSVRKSGLGSIKLYRDDFEELLDLLNSHGFVIKLADKKYEYDNLDELAKNHADSIRELSIEGTGTGSGNVSLKISLTKKFGSSLEVNDSDETFLKIKDLLRPHKRHFLVITLSVVTTISSVGFAYSMANSHKLSALAFFLVALPIGLLFMHGIGGSLSVVFFDPKT